MAMVVFTYEQQEKTCVFHEKVKKRGEAQIMCVVS